MYKLSHVCFNADNISIEVHAGDNEFHKIKEKISFKCN